MGWIDYNKYSNGGSKVILLEFDNIIFSRHVKGYGADQNIRRFYSKNLNYRDFKKYFPGFFEQVTRIIIILTAFSLSHLVM